MFFVRQNATHKIVIGPAVAVGDGFTPVTTLAVSSADEAEAILHDNGTVVDISGYTFAAITTADGYYHLTLQSGISGTVGHVTIVINDDSLILPIRTDFTVVEEAVYDAMLAASAPGYVANAPVNVAQFGGSNGTFSSGRPEVNASHWAGAATTLSAGNLPNINVEEISDDATAPDVLELFAEALDQATGQIDSGTFQASALTANALAADAVQEIRDAITGGAYALDTDANGRVRVVDGTGAGELSLTSGLLDWNAAWDAEVESEVTDGLNAYDPPTRAELTSDINSLLAYLDGWVIAKGTIGATGNDTTHLHLSGLTYGDDEINNYLIAVKDVSTGEWHARYIEDWADTGDLVTVATLPFTPEASVDLYVVLAFRQDVTGGSGLDAAGVRAALGFAAATYDTDIAGLSGRLPASLVSGRIDASVGAMAANVLTAAATAADFSTEVRTAINGGDYALATDANGRIRIVDGTGVGELDTDSGTVLLRSATEAQIDAIETDSNELQQVLSAGILARSNNANLNALLGVPDVANAAASQIIHAGTSPGSNTAAIINLQSTASAVDNYYRHCLVRITGGTGSGQAPRVINAYVGSSKQASVLPSWDTTPDATSTYVVSDSAESHVRQIETGAIVTASYTAGAINATVAPNLDAAITSRLAPTVSGRTLDVTAGGEAGLDLDNTSGALGTSQFDADFLTASLLATDAVQEIRNAITGGAYALDTDANGRLRVVDGTGAGEINTASGAIVQVDQLGTQAKADVNAEVVDCLNVDTYAEPGQGTPPATTTIQNRIAHLYKRMRNQKKQSATTFELYGDDATTVDQKATVSEAASVVTFGELVTGP